MMTFTQYQSHVTSVLDGGGDAYNTIELRDPGGKAWHVPCIIRETMYDLAMHSGYYIHSLGRSDTFPGGSRVAVVRESGSIVNSWHELFKSGIANQTNKIDESNRIRVMWNQNCGYVWVREFLRVCTLLRCEDCRRIIYDVPVGSPHGLCGKCDGKERGFVYCVESPYTGLIKIGKTRRWTHRLRDIRNAGGHQSLIPILIVRAPGSAETEAHQIAADNRVVGEWFKPGHVVDAAIEMLRGKYRAIRCL